MTDLSNSIFYKIRFDITANDSEDDLVWKIVNHVRYWLDKKYNRDGANALNCSSRHWSYLKKGGTLLSADKRVFIETAYFSQWDFLPLHDYWACRISERSTPQAEYAPREWITEIGIEPCPIGTVTFSCVLSYIDRPGFIGRCEDEPPPNVPRLILNILNDTSILCHLNTEPITLTPTPLNAGDFASFWESVLKESRRIPYIFVNKKYDSERDEWVFAVDPEKLSVAAGGNARVFYVNDNRVVAEMNELCPKNYRCYNGAIRIYYPDVNLEEVLDSHRHRYLSATTIEEFGEEQVVQMIRRALAQDVHFYETFFRIDDCREKQAIYDRYKHAKEARTKLAEEKARTEIEHQQQIDDYFEFASREEEERIKAESKLANIEDVLRKVKEENHNLSTEIESYRTLAAKNAELERVCENRLATKTLPSTPMEIAQYFDAVFGDRIAFSEDAERTLKGCRIPLGDLWEHLYALATVMVDLQLYGNGDIYSEFRQKTGIDVARGEGTMTRKDKKLMRQFVTKYHGEEIDIEAHITFPRLSQSIHFGFSKKDQRLVIGSCGEHKQIYSTQKHK